MPLLDASSISSRLLSLHLIAAAALATVHCSDTASPSEPAGNGSSSGGDTSTGGCGAATPYCAAYNICLDPACSVWCQPASGGPACDATRTAALVARCGTATIHDGCDAPAPGSSTGGGGTASSGSSSGSAAGGCPAGYPVACAGSNVCCPSNFPVCGGGCGYNCCASGAGSSSGAASSGGSGSGGGTQCHDLNSCVTGSDTTTPNGTSCTGEEVFGTITNGCGQAAYCRLCPVVNGAIDESRCGAAAIQAGQTQSGEGAGWWWCDAQSVKYLCAAAADPTSCVQF